VQLELRRDEGGGELCVSGGTGASAPNLRRDVVKLLAVLVGDNGTGCGSSIGSNLMERVSVLSSWWDGGSSIQCPKTGTRDSKVSLTTTPPSNMHPTIVVPVLVALGRGTPRAWRAALRL